MNAIEHIDKQIYYRIITLWIVCEAFIGGIIHGLKLPISGLVVGSGAVFCISMIAYYVPVKGLILKATLIVVICKILLSPQSSPLAYVAVFFQGFLGEILFFNRKYFKITCLLFSAIALLESGIQHVLITTIIYGKNLWITINNFVNRLTGQKIASDYSFIFILIYLLLHVFVGILVSILTKKVIKFTKNWGASHTDYLIPDIEEKDNIEDIFEFSAKRKKHKIGFFIIWVLLIMLFLQSWLHIGKPILPSHMVLMILIRSVFIVLTWHLLLSPIVMGVLKGWILNRHRKIQEEIKEVLLLLPSTKHIIHQSWQLSGNRKGWKRLERCCKIVLINALQKIERS